MTKIEKNKIQEFISKLADKNYSDANKALTNLVTEKIKNKVRKCLTPEPKKITKKNKKRGHKTSTKKKNTKKTNRKTKKRNLKN